MTSAESSGPGPVREGGARPLIGITMGDPMGIGAEVIVKALADPEVRSLGRFIIYGSAECIAYAADLAEINPYWFRLPHDQVRRVESGVVVADFDEEPLYLRGHPRSTAEGGAASIRYLNEAIVAAARRFIDAIVTGPIDKVAWRMAGVNFAGHTDLLAHAFRAKQTAMMFVGGGLRVALASVHEPLFELRNSFTIGRVFRPIDLLDRALREWFGIAHPRIGVCGLNPHAGDHGLFGDEEERIIKPAMVMAREAGIDVDGPFPADTLFATWRRRRLDGIVAMYHDQGLIPVKMLAFDQAVNLTLGLPILRTSVDHGVAYDIAGRNLASPGSMKEAIRLACQIVRSHTCVAEHLPQPQLPRVRTSARR